MEWLFFFLIDLERSLFLKSFFERNVTKMILWSNNVSMGIFQKGSLSFINFKHFILPICIFFN